MDTTAAIGTASARRGVALFAVLVLVLSACSTAEPTSTADATDAAVSPPPSPAPSTDLFAYDADAPPEPTVVATFEELGIEVRDVTYSSPAGGEVSALLAEPAEDPTSVGILMTHDIVGLTSTEVESRESYTEAVARFACAGATAVVVEAPWARPAARELGRNHDSAFTFTDPEQDHDEQVQMIIDLRRAVDLLEDNGAETIGFDATGSGASLGAILAGVEPRIDAFALLGGGPGPVERYIGESGSGIGPAAQTTPAEREAWAQTMASVAPAEFVGDASAPILLVAGRDDQVFTPDEMEAISQAAGATAELRLYDAPRELNAQAFQEHLDWLADQLGLDQQRIDACFADTARF